MAKKTKTELEREIKGFVAVAQRKQIRLEHDGLGVLIEDLPGRIGGTISVWANAKAARRARKLEKLLADSHPSGSRGEARRYFYWWHDAPMPELETIRKIATGGM